MSEPRDTLPELLNSLQLKAATVYRTGEKNASPSFVMQVG